MRIHLLSLNYAPEQIGIGPYSAEMAASLVAAGHDVRVITAKPYYPAWSVDPAFAGGSARRRTHDGVTVTHHAIYVPRRPTGPRRLLHHLSFAMAVLPAMLRHGRRERPDIVMAIAPSLIAAKVAVAAARLSGARTWLHVQDFEVEAAFATGLMRENGWRGWVARRYERAVLGAFDRVSTISPQMCLRLAAKGVAAERIVEFRNWADITAIRPLDRPSAYRAEFGITTPHVALYSGNISFKQGIEILAEAARLLVDRPDLTMVICGDGPELPMLKAACAGLANVRFFPLQPRDRLGELVGLATVHLMPQKADAADLVLPSKLTNMFASGRPIVATADAGTGLAEEVAGTGLIVPPGDAPAFAAAICRLLDDPAMATAMGAAARQRAEDRWEKGAILAGLERRMTALTAGARITGAAADRLSQPAR